MLGGPPDTWFRARITGFVCRCGLPPIRAELISTENGDADRDKLPPSLEAFCRKSQLKCVECGQMLKGMRAHVCGEPDEDNKRDAPSGIFADKAVADGAKVVSKGMAEWTVHQHV